MKPVDYVNADIAAVFARYGIQPGPGPDGFGAAARAVWQKDRDDFWRLADLCGAWFAATDEALKKERKGRTS